MAPGGRPSAGGPSPPASSSGGGSVVPPSPAPGRSRRIAWAVILLALLLVASVALSGVIPGFSPLSHGGGPPPSTAQHVVTFEESGLPPGTPWAVTLDVEVGHSTNTTLSFVVLDGTYVFNVDAVTGHAANPSGGSVVVSGADQSVAVVFSPIPHAVTFTESGLPAGTNWSVVLNGTRGSATTSSIEFARPNGFYPYTVDLVAGYHPTPSAGTVSVANGDTNVTVVFEPNTLPTYLVTFRESGLPAGTSWAVTLNATERNSTTASLLFAVTNGSYGFAVGAIPYYSASPDGGSVNVTGSDVSVNVTFTPSAGGVTAYPVTFTQSGLLANVSWEVFAFALNVTGYPEVDQLSEGPNQSVDLPNGTYEWAAALAGSDPAAPAGALVLASPTAAELNVSGGPASAQVTFETIAPTATTYSVTLTESGLPSGGTWFTTLDGSSRSAPTGSPIVYTEPNGSYYYNASASAPGFGGGGVYGDVNVEGTPAGQTVVFTYETDLTFVGNGTAYGVPWTVFLNGSGYAERFTQFGPGPLTIFVANGTYGFSAEANGYNAAPPTGTVTARGLPVSVELNFTPIPTSPLTITEAGLPAATEWAAEVCPSEGFLYACNTTVGPSSTFTVWLADGNYSWMVYAVTPGYLASPMSGSVEVNGTAQVVHTSFTAIAANYHIVLFTEFDLYYYGTNGAPNGTSWSATFDGTTETTNGEYIDFAVPNGTFTYSVTAPVGYSALPVGGRLTVNATGPALGDAPSAEVDVAIVPLTHLPADHLAAPTPAGSLRPAARPPTNGVARERVVPSAGVPRDLRDNALK